VAAEVARLDAAYDRHHLAALILNRGLEAASQTTPTASPAPDRTEAP